VKRIIIYSVLFLFVALMLPAVSGAQPMGRGMYRGAPYGHYCPGMQWGPYGVRKPVATAEQARQVIEVYLADNGQNLTVGNITEKNWYFEAEILNRDKAVIDRVIVDKRSGRIRSIY
jgi:hypothetical protein